MPPAALPFDAKSPPKLPKALKSDRALSQRAAQYSHREPEHEAFGLEPPPTLSEIKGMMAATAVRTLKEYLVDATTVASVCERFGTLARANEAGRQEATSAGALPAIVEAMTKHSANDALLGVCIGALGNLCCGTDAAGLGRKEAAADAGALESIVHAMQLHPTADAVQENGAAALGNIVANVDDAGFARKQKAADAGALEVVIAALSNHKANAMVCDFACFALGNLVRGKGEQSVDDAGAARKRRAVELGAIPTIVEALHQHMDAPRVQEFGSRAIANITFRSDEYKKIAMEAGAMQDWLDGACTARVFVPDKEREDAGTSATVDAAAPSATAPVDVK